LTVGYVTPINHSSHQRKARSHNLIALFMPITWQVMCGENTL